MPLMEAWAVMVKILLYKNITYDFVGKYEEFFAWTHPKKNTNYCNNVILPLLMCYDQN